MGRKSAARYHSYGTDSAQCGRTESSGVDKTVILDGGTGRHVAEALRGHRKLPPFFRVARIAAENRTVKLFIRSNQPFFWDFFGV